MKIAAMTTLILMTAVAAHAESRIETAARTVNVCVQTGDIRVPAGEVPLAQDLASRMFVKIGVTIVWHTMKRCPAQSILISLTRDTPTTLQPDALAYALEYEGTHIRVFYDRVVNARMRSLAPFVLGHVFGHEITHMLQGVPRHSASGIMKAKWNWHDFADMSWKPLGFEADDVELVYIGLAHRAARRALPLNSPNSLNAVAGQ
jgi:hypothetical protein